MANSSTPPSLRIEVLRSLRPKTHRQGGDSWILYPLEAREHYLQVLSNLDSGGWDDKRQPAFECVREALKHGLPRQAFDRIKQATHTTTEDLLKITGITQRTLSRRKIRFQPDESERIFRVASVFQKALETLEEPESCQRWFHAPKRALNGLTPLECCDTEAGAREVENLLGRIAHGVFS